LTRAAGIPARQAVGYAYTTNTKLRPLSLNTDVLHAWPEYYDRQTGEWKPIDPTWASTTGGIDYYDKLDFNHIVFAYNGYRDDYPYPAGSYKTSENTARSIDVGFADPQDAVAAAPAVAAMITFPQNIFSAVSSTGEVAVTNTSGTAATDVSVQIVSSPQAISLDRTLAYLPPYGGITIPFTLKIPNIFSVGKGYIRATVGTSPTEARFSVYPFAILLLTIVSGLSIISIIVWFAYRHRKKTSS
jgi:hypothetical protein